MKTALITALILALAPAAFAEREITLTWDKNPELKGSIIIYEKQADGSSKELGSVPVSPEKPPEEITLTFKDEKTTVYAVARDTMGLKSDPSETLEIPSKLTAPKGMRIVVDVKVTVTQ